MILIVADLDKAAADFEGLGFTVTKRDDVPGSPSENRLIVFADGSYIELLYLADPDYAAKHRFAPLLAVSEGWADYSLWSDDLDADKARLDAAHVPNKRAPDFSKALVDGRKWTVALIQAGRGTGRDELPFFAMDGSPRALRVPDTGTRHGNGATRIAGARLLTDDLDGLAPQLDAVTGASATPLAKPFCPGRGMRWTVGDLFIEAVEPEPASPEAGLVKARGAGLYEVVLETSAAAGGRLLERGATHGARIRLA